MTRPLSFLLFALLLPASPLLSRDAPAQEPHRSILVRTNPAYPELARRMHVAGTVMIAASIRPDGTVAAAKAQSGHALLVNAAETAVRQWHFSPSAQPSETVVAISFMPESR